jgi:hypothetical protein
MPNFRDAERAVPNLAGGLDRNAQQAANTIASTFGAAEDRLLAIEAILQALAQKVGVSEAEVVKMAEDRLNASRFQMGSSNPVSLPYHTQSEIRRILAG